MEKRSGVNAGLSHKLMQSHAGVPYDVYLSRAYLISILLSVPFGLLIYILFNELFGFFGDFSEMDGKKKWCRRGNFA